MPGARLRRFRDTASRYLGRTDAKPAEGDLKVFFLNLGGYKAGLFDELHFKYLCVAKNKGLAVQSAKKTIFYREAGFPGAESHIDERFAVDVDDIYEIRDILPADQKEKYRIHIYPSSESAEDDLHLGYFKLASL